MDVAVDPDYNDNGFVYLSYSHVLDEQDSDDNRPPAMTRIVRGQIMGNIWTNEKAIFEAPHEMYRTTRHHYGSRIVFDKKGLLYFSIGDRGARDHAQDLSRPNGKIHRIRKNGEVPVDNPFGPKAQRIDITENFYVKNHCTIRSPAPCAARTHSSLLDR